MELKCGVSEQKPRSISKNIQFSNQMRWSPNYLCLSITRVELSGAEPLNIPKIWDWQNQKYPQYYQIWGGEKPVSIPKIIRLFI